MKNIFLLLTGLTVFGCGIDEEKADAYGNFEAEVITVSALASGTIKSLNVQEGRSIDSGQYLGFIDTTQLHLKKEQLMAQYEAIQARSPGISAEIEVLEEQLRAAKEELERFRPLVEEGAATQKQVDDLKNRISLLEKKISRVRVQNLPLSRELGSVRTQIKQLDQQIEEARVYAPFKGTVLKKLKQAGELATMGSPLFRMTDLDTLSLKAFLSGPQLTEVKLGQQVEVRVDESEDSMISYTGVIRNIAEEAEFTPKTIQTKEQRVDLVYAMEIAVPNDGKLKSGMPAEVYFTSQRPQGQ